MLNSDCNQIIVLISSYVLVIDLLLSISFSFYSFFFFQGVIHVLLPFFLFFDFFGFDSSFLISFTFFFFWVVLDMPFFFPSSSSFFFFYFFYFYFFFCTDPFLFITNLGDCLYFFGCLLFLESFNLWRRFLMIVFYHFFWRVSTYGVGFWR